MCPLDLRLSAGFSCSSERMLRPLCSTWMSCFLFCSRPCQTLQTRFDSPFFHTLCSQVLSAATPTHPLPCCPSFQVVSLDLEVLAGFSSSSDALFSRFIHSLLELFSTDKVYIFLAFSLSVSLPSLCQFFACCLSFSLFLVLFLPFHYPSSSCRILNLSIYLSVCVSVCLSVCLPVCLSVRLSVVCLMSIPCEWVPGAG